MFDAKYRWKRRGTNTFVPNPDDMDTMHKYYNSIQYKRSAPTSTTLRSRGTIPPPFVSSAYSIYPGNKIHTQDNDRIGALPFFPNISEGRLHDIQEKLKDLLYYAYVID
nr:nuclease domain-containing protein [Dictyobacter kobayashii]